MKMPGKKTGWAFKDTALKRQLKKRVLRAEEKEWREESATGCCEQTCVFPDCDCEELD